jgi:hypothetical protein
MLANTSKDHDSARHNICRLGLPQWHGSPDHRWGTLFDLPDVVADARQLSVDEGVAERCDASALPLMRRPTRRRSLSTNPDIRVSARGAVVLRDGHLRRVRVLEAG